MWVAEQLKAAVTRGNHLTADGPAWSWVRVV